jgi:NDP-sugar pyrophosphorylase family protein
MLLDTGGGLKKASWFFLGNLQSVDEPFLLHNVDVISTIDLARMARFHTERNALATLAVQNRETSRYLLFDALDRLCGRRVGQPGVPDLHDAAQQIQAFAFSGIHVLSPRIFEKMHEEGAFSIISAYLGLAAQGEKILAFRADDSYWRDLGRPQNLVDAARDLAGGLYAGA